MSDITGTLVNQLQEMGRDDAVHVLMSSAPLYHLTNQPSLAEQGAYHCQDSNIIINVSETCEIYSKNEKDASALEELKTLDPTISNFGELNCDSRFTTSNFTSNEPSTSSKSSFNSVDSSSLSISQAAVTASHAPTVSTIVPSTLNPSISDRTNSSKDNVTTDIDKAQRVVQQESLFSSDDQISPGQEFPVLEKRDVTSSSCLTERTLSPALFTLDESFSSQSAFSTIPPSSSITSTVVLPSSKKVSCNKVELLNACSLDNSPDITSSCTVFPNNLKMSYVLPDVASDSPGKSSNKPHEPCSFPLVSTSFDAHSAAIEKN